MRARSELSFRIRLALVGTAVGLLATSACGEVEAVIRAQQTELGCLAVGLGTVMCTESIFSQPAPTEQTFMGDPIETPFFENVTSEPTATDSRGEINLPFPTDEPTPMAQQTDLAPGLVLTNPVPTAEVGVYLESNSGGDEEPENDWSNWGESRPEVVYMGENGHNNFIGRTYLVTVTTGSEVPNHLAAESVSLYYEGKLPEYIQDQFEELLGNMAVMQQAYEQDPYDLPDPELVYMYAEHGVYMAKGNFGTDVVSEFGPDLVRQGGIVDIWEYKRIPQEFRGDLGGEAGWVMTTMDAQEALDFMGRVNVAVESVWKELDALHGLSTSPYNYEHPPVEVYVVGPAADGTIIRNATVELVVLINEATALDQERDPVIMRELHDWLFGNEPFYNTLFSALGENAQEIQVMLGERLESGEIVYNMGYAADRLKGLDEFGRPRAMVTSDWQQMFNTFQDYSPEMWEPRLGDN